MNAPRDSVTQVSQSDSPSKAVACDTVSRVSHFRSKSNRSNDRRESVSLNALPIEENFQGLTQTPPTWLISARDLAWNCLTESPESRSVVTATASRMLMRGKQRACGVRVY